MKWRRLGDHTAESDAGYCVLRCTANGKPTGRFIAFRGKTRKGTSYGASNAFPVVLGGFDSADAAKQACESDLNSKREAA